MNTYVITMQFSIDNTDDVIQFRSEVENYIDTPDITTNFQYMTPTAIAFKTDKDIQQLIEKLNALNTLNFVIFKSDTVVANSKYPTFGLDQLGFEIEG